MIRLLTSGFWTSIQDLGRYGHRHQGIPLAGAMDHQAAIEANKVAGNAATTPVLELTASGPKLETDQPCFMAVTGGFDLLVNGKQFKAGEKCFVPKNAGLEFVSNGKGFRAYLAVRGGFDCPRVLGSYSQYQQLTPAARLHKGDELELAATGSFGSWKPIERYAALRSDRLRAYPGPEWEQLAPEIQDRVLEGKWSVGSGSNRMAYLLDPQEGVTGFDIVTAPVQPGIVQLTPAGNLVILMRDAQTTGGYARILQLDEASIDYVAQRTAGEALSFELISL